MIVRSDAQGLERTLKSAQAYVDEIFIGIDARSDSETVQVARAFTPNVWFFNASDIGLTDEAWTRNEIDFAKARNLGRSRIQTPWTLVLDSDEFLEVSGGADVLRQAAREASPEVASFRIAVDLEGVVHKDVQRLARTQYRWARAAHNILVFEGAIRHAGLPAATIYHDLSLRSSVEKDRRTQQRNAGVDALEEAAKNGDENAVFHIAKHRIGTQKEAEALKWVEMFRNMVLPQGPIGREERAHLAAGMSMLYYNLDRFDEAELWAIRALLDGPSIDAFCLLGDLAEDRGNLKAARVWYEAACVTELPEAVGMSQTPHVRWGRRAALRAALGEKV